MHEGDSMEGVTHQLEVPIDIHPLSDEVDKRLDGTLTRQTEDLHRHLLVGRGHEPRSAEVTTLKKKSMRRRMSEASVFFRRGLWGLKNASVGGGRWGGRLL